MAKQLYGIFIKHRDKWITYYCGSLLGGIGCIDKKWFHDRLELLWQKSDPVTRTVGLRGMLLAYHKSKTVELPESVLRKTGIIKPGMPSIMRSTAIQLVFLLCKFKPRWFSAILFELVKHGSPETKIEIARNLFGKKLDDPELELDLIEILMAEKKPQVIESILYYLSGSGTDFLERKFAIIKNIIEQEMYFIIPPLDWHVERLGSPAPIESLNIIETWIGPNMSFCMQFYLPIMAVLVAASKPEELFLRFLKWVEKDETHRKIAVKGLEELLTRVYDGLQIPYGWLDNAKNTLADLVRKTRQNPNGILRHRPRKDDDPVEFYSMICLRLIDLLKTKPIKVDYDNVRKVLSEYPNMSKIFDEAWITRMERYEFPPHEIAKLIMYAYPIETDTESVPSSHIRRYLEYIDQLLSVINSDEKEIETIGGRLRDKFHPTLSEIELVYVFRNAGLPVKIEPTIGSKTVDLSIKKGGTEIYFEIVNPIEFLELRYLKRAVTLKRDRVKAIALREFKKHIKPVLDSINSPIILAIDGRRSEIDLEDVRAALHGSLAVGWIVDSSTGKIGETYLTRKDDYLHKKEPRTDVWSAILYYKSSLQDDKSISFQVHIVENMFARYKLTETQKSAILESFSKTQFRNK